MMAAELQTNCRGEFTCETVDRAIALVHELTLCREQPAQTTSNVEIARTKSRGIAARVEEAGIMPMRKAGPEAVFLRTLKDLSRIRESVDAAFERVLKQFGDVAKNRSAA